MGTPDFNFSFLTSTEANYAAALLDLFRGLALGLDTTVSNPPTGAIRWSSANARFEQYNGTSWAALVAKYLIDVDTLDGLHAADLALVGHNHSGVYQPLDAELSALAGLVSAADKAPYFTGSGAAALMTVTSAARTLLAAADAAAQRTALGLAIGTNVQAYDATLEALAALTTAANKLIYATGSDTFATCDFTAFARTMLAAADAAAVRTALGVDSGSTDVILFHAFMAQISAGRASGAIPGGYMHLFATDELATKTNATYLAAADVYANIGALSGTKTTLTAGLISASGLTSFSAAAMINGTTANNEGGYVPNGTAAGVYVQIDFGAGVAKAIGKWRTFVYAAASSGGWKVQFSDNGSSWTDASGTVDFGNGVWTELSWSYVGEHRYWRIVTTASAAGQGWLSEIELYEFGTPTNMTLIPTAITASAAPSLVDVHLLHKSVDAVTLNTDLKARVSRDNGANWSAYVTLSVVCQYDSNFKHLKGTADLSALASGTSVKWEITTLNTKSQQLRAVGMQLR